MPPFLQRIGNAGVDVHMGEDKASPQPRGVATFQATAPSRTEQDLGLGSLGKMPRGHETEVSEDGRNEVTLPGAQENGTLIL